MSQLPSSSGFPRHGGTDEVGLELERMIEQVENNSVLLTWMAYDVVALRTNPQLLESLREMEEAYRRCKACVRREPEPQTEPSNAPGLFPAAAPPPGP